MRESMEYPTMRPDQASFIAHMYSLPSPVLCSVISVNHTWLGPVAKVVNWRLTRSSCTGGPGRR